MTTTQGNILIADSQFGGMRKDFITKNGTQEFIGYTHESIDSIWGNKSHHIGDALKYHTSWDWLMPVVEKIEALHFATQANGYPSHDPHNFCILTPHPMQPDRFIAKEATKILSHWACIVQFIQWFNTQSITP